MIENFHNRPSYGKDDGFNWFPFEIRAQQEVINDLEVFMDGERAVAKSIETRDEITHDGTRMGKKRMSFNTVASYSLTLGLEEAVLMSSTVMLKPICTSSSDGYSASMWAFIQGFEIIFCRCPWVC